MLLKGLRKKPFENVYQTHGTSYFWMFSSAVVMCDSSTWSTSTPNWRNFSIKNAEPPSKLNLPMPILIAISHAEARLTHKCNDVSLIIDLALSDNFVASSSAHFAT